MDMNANYVKRAKQGLTFVCAIIAASALAIGAAHASQFKRIKDINVACTNALECDLFISNPRVTLAAVGLRRSAAPDAPVALVLLSREALARGSDVWLAIDGNEVARFAVEDFSYRAALSEYTLFDDAVVKDIISAAANGRQLEVHYQARQGLTSARFDLPGFVDGLVFMDQVQGRIGSGSALSGQSDSGQNSGAYEELSSLSDVPFAIRSRYFTGSNAFCAQPDEAVFSGFRFDVTGQSSPIYGLSCGMAGSDNAATAFFTFDGRNAEILSLPTIASGSLTTTKRAFNARFSPATATLTAVFKARDTGSCGRFEQWSVGGDQSEGLAFQLINARSKAECDDAIDAAPESWPQVWPVVSN